MQNATTITQLKRNVYYEYMIIGLNLERNVEYVLKCQTLVEIITNIETYNNAK